MTVDLNQIFELPENLNEGIRNNILSVINQKSDKSMDYIKFKVSIQNLKKMGMDEGTSIKSAYATASTMGLTKDELMKSIQYYQNIIDDEREEFVKTLAHQIDIKITAPTNKANEYKAEASKLEQELVDIQKKIEAYKKGAEQIMEEVKASEEKIEHTKAEFRAVYDGFTASLNEDRTLFSSLL